MLVPGNVDIVAALLELDSHPRELRRNDPEVFERNVFDRDPAAGHRGHADKAAHLDHIGQQRMRGPVQTFDPVDHQQIRRDPRNQRPHAVQHPAQLLHVRLAGRIVDRRPALRQHGRHDDVGGTGHRSLVEQHVTSLQVFARNGKKVRAGIEIEFGPELLKTDEMRVQPPTSDFVAARLRDVTDSVARQQRPDNHHRTAQPGRPVAVVVALQVIEIDLLRLERVRALAEPVDDHPHLFEQFDQLQHVDDGGNVMDNDLLRRQQRGAQYLQRLVLGPLRTDLAFERRSSLHFKCCHKQFSV